MPTSIVNITVSAVGNSILNAADPAAVTWIRVNADNTITYRTAAETLSDIGAQGAGTYLVPADIGVTVQGYDANTTVLGNSVVGSGDIVLATSPILQTSLNLDYGTADQVAFLDSSKNLIGSSNFIFDGANNDLTVGDATKAVLGVNGSSEIVYVSATNGFIVNDTGGTPLFWADAATSNIEIRSVPYLFPAADGVGVLTSDGAGALTWAAASSGITINSTAITGGGANRILFENSSNQVSESVNELFFTSSSPYSHIFAAGRTATLTGINNTLFGYRAGRDLTTGTNNIYIGFQAGVTATNNTNNVVITTMSGALGTQGSNNTLVGYRLETGGSQNTMIGGQSGTSSAVTGSNNVFVGYNTTFKSYSGQYNLVLGRSSGFYSTAAISGSISLNSTQGCTASNQMVVGSNADGLNNSITQVYIGSGVTNSTPASFTLNATGGSGTNIAGAALTIAGGKGTGNSAGGDVIEQTSVKGASGTTLQTLGDRHVTLAKYVDLTESSATSFLRINCPTGTVCGGVIHFTIEANDGTDFQAYTEEARFSIVNKAGTLTIALSVAPGSTDAMAASVGTLTATLTAIDSGSGNADFQLDAVSSLTQTVLRVNAMVKKNFGTGSISSL